ncbi:ABC transporter substrate-binding protein [Roseospira marina]|uniref:ABC transporter substrate-binding protein n=1 Tax=Roseospira marina TaxID=140057 RepID=A0A5M6IC79_9PROT|nr:ABC transporter substrate-binding protein [Roseospira marina]KAA5605732.1 ABC transporter substrate-binding protein [Roseospira marina]MBB4313533.1 peptide/nickel transport system substrate-binding protein [Roseospira marina]MBB5086695.1 peptide/nickel transport system substrate-binding protein [Roseospira marina]
MRTAPHRQSAPVWATGVILAVVLLALGLVGGLTAARAAPVEPPILADAVAAGALPPMAQRLPDTPRVINLASQGKTVGRPGGSIATLMARDKDIRLMTVYGYSRLVCYTPDLELVPDILRDVTVEEGRIFTLYLRPGHRWSDGHPFTTEDFRYWWEDMALNPVLSPGGPPPEMVPHGAPPTVEVLGPRSIRYTWVEPNPLFLPALAGARPLEIFRPAHYLRQFHADYADPEALAKRIKDEDARDWRALHFTKDRWYRNTNPDLPTLDPWRITTEPPAQRYVFQRNPYFHRVDTSGQQLPYLDRVVLDITDAKLVPAKTAAGETDLQSRYLGFDNYTVLKAAQQRGGPVVSLWREGQGSSVALYPNLTTNDPVWRAVLRQADVRRALSLAIDRHEVNQVVFFGLGLEANNTLLPESPLYVPDISRRYTDYDPARANALLDSVGLDTRDSRGTRLLPDGRPMELIVEEDGEDRARLDALRLIQDHWAALGIRMYIRTFSREVLKRRVYAGSSVMVAAYGLNNGLATPEMPPSELVPVAQDMWQWSQWGQYHETRGEAGEAVDMPAGERLMELYDAWMLSTSRAEQVAIWKEILALHAENQFSIGVVSGGNQPVVHARALRNLPAEALYTWEPGAHFGIYGMDTLFLAPPESAAATNTASDEPG